MHTGLCDSHLSIRVSVSKKVNWMAQSWSLTVLTVAFERTDNCKWESSLN